MLENGSQPESPSHKEPSTDQVDFEIVRLGKHVWGFVVFETGSNPRFSRTSWINRAHTMQCPWNWSAGQNSAGELALLLVAQLKELNQQSTHNFHCWNIFEAMSTMTIVDIHFYCWSTFEAMSVNRSEGQNSVGELALLLQNWKSVFLSLLHEHCQALVLMESHPPSVT